MTSTPPADSTNGAPPQAPALPHPPVAPGEPASSAPPPQAYPAPRRTGTIAWGLGLLILVPLVHVDVLAMAITVVSIVGMVKASQGNVFRPFSITFFRP